MGAWEIAVFIVKGVAAIALKETEVVPVTVSSMVSALTILFELQTLSVAVVSSSIKVPLIVMSSNALTGSFTVAAPEEDPDDQG